MDSPHSSCRAPQGVRPGLALALLVAARLVSASLNIIHDCDETFNYLEPLHYLLNGYGMQTWEYSAEFALRPYVYLLLHTVVGAPAAAIAGAGEGAQARAGGAGDCSWRGGGNCQLQLQM